MKGLVMFKKQELKMKDELENLGSDILAYINTYKGAELEARIVKALKTHRDCVADIFK